MAKQTRTPEEQKATRDKRYKFIRNLSIGVIAGLLILAAINSIFGGISDKTEAKRSIANARLTTFGLTDEHLETQESISEQISQFRIPPRGVPAGTLELKSKFEEAVANEFWIDSEFSINSAISGEFNQLRLNVSATAECSSLELATVICEQAAKLAIDNSTLAWDVIKVVANGATYNYIPGRYLAKLPPIPMEAPTSGEYSIEQIDFGTLGLKRLRPSTIQARKYGDHLNLTYSTEESITPEELVADFYLLFEWSYRYFTATKLDSITMNITTADSSISEFLDAGTGLQYGKLSKDMSPLGTTIVNTQFHRYYGEWSGTAQTYIDNLLNTLSDQER